MSNYRLHECRKGKESENMPVCQGSFFSSKTGKSVKWEYYFRFCYFCLTFSPPRRRLVQNIIQALEAILSSPHFETDEPVNYSWPGYSFRKILEMPF